MGLTRLRARVFDLARTAPPFEGEFLVDTGAIDCMVPGDKLLRAGVQPERKSLYELANGESVEYDVGFARFAFLDVETVAPVVFGPPDTEPLLGVVALESAGFIVDPLSQTIRRLRAKPLK